VSRKPSAGWRRRREPTVKIHHLDGDKSSPERKARWPLEYDDGVSR